MSETPASKSQQRALRLKSLPCASTYVEASQLLEAEMLPADGVPSGLTWRSAAKLKDEQLRQLLVPSFNDDFDFETVVDGRGGVQ